MQRSVLIAAVAAAIGLAAGTHIGSWSALEEARPDVSRARSGCLTDTDCSALEDDRALVGWGCSAPEGEEAWWEEDEPLYRDEEDEFPSMCDQIYAVDVVP